MDRVVVCDTRWDDEMTRDLRDSPIYVYMST
jgi:hypothetical protein